MGRATLIQGEFLKQNVYVYQPGMHNGWRLGGTNPMVLYFGESTESGACLKSWEPLFPDLKPVQAQPSEATRDTLSEGTLHIGNLHFAGSAQQFDVLLGPPDQQRTEYDLTYSPGKRSMFAMDSVSFQLHFNEKQKLTRITCTED